MPSKKNVNSLAAGWAAQAQAGTALFVAKAI
jgi:hypothetical protein